MENLTLNELSDLGRKISRDRKRIHTSTTAPRFTVPKSSRKHFLSDVGDSFAIEPYSVDRPSWENLKGRKMFVQPFQEPAIKRGYSGSDRHPYEYKSSESIVTKIPTDMVLYNVPAERMMVTDSDYDISGSGLGSMGSKASDYLKKVITKGLSSSLTQSLTKVTSQLISTGLVKSKAINAVASEATKQISTQTQTQAPAPAPAPPAQPTQPSQQQTGSGFKFPEIPTMVWIGGGALLLGLIVITAVKR